MTQTSRLVIEISSENAERNAKIINRELERLTSKGNEAAKSVDGLDKNLGLSSSAMEAASVAARRLIGYVAGMAAGIISLNKVIAVQRQFDVLNAGLITATKSAEGASEAFNALNKFARDTPYSLDQAVEGFTKLVNLGLTPSERALRSYGNTASAMGKDLIQMIEAVADASTGEFERLKEFGIKAKSQGDQIAFTFQGTTTKVKNSADAIEEYLLKIGENEFAGAMTERMNTLDGSISNLEDSWNNLFLAVSQAGTGEAVRDSVDLANAAISHLTELVSSGAIESSLGGMSTAFGVFGDDARGDLESIADAFGLTTDYMVRKWQATISELNTIGNTWTTLRALVQKASVSVAAGVDVFSDPFNRQTSGKQKNQNYLDSLAAIDEEAMARWDGVSKGSEQATKQLEEYRTKMKATGGNATDLLAKYKIASKKDGSNDEEDKKKKKKTEAEREAEQRLREFERVRDSLRSETEVYNDEFSKRKALILEFTKVGSQERERLLTMSQATYQEDLANYEVAMNEKTLSYKRNLMTEEKLIQAQAVNEIVTINNTVAYSKEKRAELVEYVKLSAAQQLKEIKLRNQQEILSAQQGYLTQIDYMRQRYALEREEIALTEGKTEEWRKAMLAASMLNQGNDTANMQFSSGAAIAGLKADLNGTGEYFDAEQQLAQRMAIVQEGLDTETLAIQEAVALRQQIYQDYYNSITELTLSKGEEIFGSLASIAKDTAGEQSAAYRAMFAVSKGFAIAESAIKIQQALAQALGDPTAITPAQKLVNYGIIASQAANIVSSLSSVTANGFSAGGYTGPGGKYDVAGLVHKGEVVWSQEDIKRWGGVGAVEAMRTGTRVDNAIAAQSRSSGSSGNVYVYNNTSSSVSTQKDDAGNTYITIDDVRREIDSYVPAQLARPNSSISKGLKRNYNTESRR